MACKDYEIHDDRIYDVMNNMPKDETLIYTADFFDAFGDFTRLKILLALVSQELCTCDISVITGLTPSAISHQLRVLKDRNIVTYKRKGKNVFYRLEDQHIKEILSMALEHIGERYGKNL